MSETKALIALTTLEGVGPARITTIINQLDAQHISVELLLDCSATDLVNDGLLTAAQADQFVSSETQDAVADWIDRLDAYDIQVIPVTSSRYPRQLVRSLGTSSPPVLYVYGPPELLQTTSIAFAGAREVSSQGINSTAHLARSAVERGFTVVSGGARGVDDTAHQTAVDAGGSTFLVLVEGILSSRAISLVSSVGVTSTVILSTFLPDDPWQRWRAMERNKYILGLSDRLIVIEAAGKGGTLAAGKEALKRNVPTWVLEYDDHLQSASGNQMLLELGARPIPISRDGEVQVPPRLFDFHVQPDEPLQQRKLF